MPGFRYVLELPDGQPPDPALFNTALPSVMWQPGQTFLAGSDLEEFRIDAIGQLDAAGYLHADGLWIVRAVGLTGAGVFRA